MKIKMFLKEKYRFLGCLLYMNNQTVREKIQQEIT